MRAFSAATSYYDKTFASFKKSRVYDYFDFIYERKNNSMKLSSFFEWNIVSGI